MKIAAALALASIPLSVFAADGLPNQPYIYVKGSAEAEKPPDVVTLRFALVARAPEQVKANADVQARAAKVFDLLNKRNIAKNDTDAPDLSSEAKFDETEGGKPGKLIGYEVERQFNVKVRDISAFPKLVDDLIASANAEFRGIYGAYSKAKEMDKQLWEQAIANAREQAERTASKAGMKIDSVFAISPVPVPEITNRMVPRGESGTERVIVTGSNIPTAEEVGPASEYRLPPESFEQIVHAIYLMSPAK